MKTPDEKPHIKRMQGTLTPYEPIEMAVLIVASRDIKRLLKGAPDPLSLRLHPNRKCLFMNNLRW